MVARQKTVGALLLATTLAILVWQQSGLAQDANSGLPGPQGDAQSLSAHYRFLEGYTDDPAKTGLLNQYQVAYRETIKLIRDKPQGDPDTDQLVVQTIYTERVVKAAISGQLSDVIRRYEKANFKTTVEIRPYKTMFLEGLTVLYRFQPGRPQVLSLTGRQLREREYASICQETFLPILTTILPRQAVRVGDTWSIPQMAAWALLGSQPTEEGYDLNGELVGVRKDATGTSMTAVIGVKGQCVVQQGPSGINAVIHFTFETSSPEASSSPTSRSPAAGGEPTASKAAGRPSTPGIYDAKGYISKVSLAQESNQALSQGNDRRKQLARRELILERRLLAQAPGGIGSLEVPNPLPQATPSNSWLIYDDPQGRFHLLHPQELNLDRQHPDGGITLLDRRPDRQDLITLTLVPKSGDPQRDRLAADPLQESKRIEDEWKRSGEKVLPGPQGWLPETDWATLKRKVYRIEAAIMSAGDPASPPSGRTYVDHYIVQFSRNEAMIMSATTSRDPHIAFRDMAEALIKSFEFGPSDSSLPASPSPTTSAPSAPAR
jgi:hypothetical protein